MIVCDYLTVSTPRENGPTLRDALTDVVLELPGASTVFDAVKVGTHARMHYRERMNVATVSASGVLLAKLRVAELFAPYLGTIASNGPYKVTHLDLARDEEQDAPAYLALLYARLRIHGATLTRKTIPPESIRTMLSRGRDGRDTGSIMIGDRRSQETTAIVYDRRHDARSKGKEDPGPLVRTEIRTGIPGLTLKDAWEPEPLFWHFASPTFGPRPATVAEWQPWGEGFVVPQHEIDAFQRLANLVECSGDLDRMLALAGQVPDGLHHLQRLISRRFAVHLQTLKFSAGRDAAEPAGEQLRNH